MKTTISPTQMMEASRAVLDRDDPVRATIEALAAGVAKAIGRQEVPGLAIPELPTFDLERDIANVAEQLEHVLREEPAPAEIRYLLIGSYAISDGTEPEWVACWIMGETELRPDDPEWSFNHPYSASRFQIQSALLDEIHRHVRADDSCGELIAAGLLEPATGVVFRAAVRQLGLPYSVVVVRDDAEPVAFVLR